MQQITITANDAERRLDRFLRKYLPDASLSSIYKIIRKDIKINGRRQKEEYMLVEGDIIDLYLSDEMIASLRKSLSGKSRSNSNRKARRNFKIIYEDKNILVVDKPYGLLSHGDSTEKKNHLANQVKDYLIESGSFNPREEKVFSPAPANRLDRNTTGLVICGKTSEALKGLGSMIREDHLSKFYSTIVHGVIDKELYLDGYLLKDNRSNKVRILDKPVPESKQIITIVNPICSYGDYTLIEVELVTGRSHQIRAHLASIGHPLIGDVKYGGKKVFGLTTQLLHATKLRIDEAVPGLKYLEIKTFSAPLPDEFDRVIRAIKKTI